jgi:hypothetical protein
VGGTPWNLELQVEHQALTYRLVERGTAAAGPTLLEGAEWADLDHRGRLCFARHGRLFAARLEAGDWRTEELADFSPDRPRRLPPVDAQGQPLPSRPPRARGRRR